ncbi:MAG: aspartate aminotransferase family protein [Elusimicrobia bacterium]|nr:aspartate aminotransferase family protein [Elusimicrobiota bacterium]
MNPPYGYPRGDVFYRSLSRKFPKIVRGEGCWLYDEAGKAYLDACGGAYVANLGHGVTEIAQAIGEQAAKVAYVNGTQFTSEPVEALARELAELSPGDLKKSYFLSSGSEAVEAALKFARQYWVEKGKPSKHKILTQTPGYHGNTLLALSASARGKYKTYYKPWLVDVGMVPAPYAYRCACRGDSKDCPSCSGSVLEEIILREGPANVAAFVMEPVGGSSTGGSVPRPDYWKRVREICDRHEVLLIADEVLTGAGRTGKWCAMEHFGAVPDLMTLGKGLSGGYVPISALVAPERLIDVLAKSDGLMHAQTFSHTPTLCAAGLAAVRRLRSQRLIERARDTGKILQDRLSALASLHGVGDVRGIGMLLGVEFVRDKDSRAPFPRSLKMAETFVAHALEEGLVVWPNTGQADGENGDLVMIAPPFTISKDEIEQIALKFERALERTIRTLTAKT